MPSRKIEQQMDALSALRQTGPTEAAVATLRKALADRINLVVAKAAAVTAQLGVRALLPDLLMALNRLLDGGADADPQCWGKNALAKALKDLGHDESACFIRGLQYVQMEPVWGLPVDTAGTLRSICVLALLQCADLTREDKLWRQMRALTDGEAAVRIEAVRALEEMEGSEAALLLGLKARTGDGDASVTGQALAGLLALERERAVPFVVDFLEAPQEGVQAEAALALGASRQHAAVQALLDFWQRSPKRRGDALLRGISASRQDVALDFLLRLIREGREQEALAAIDALALHRDSPDIRARVAEAVATRSEASIAEQFRLQFPAG